MRPVPLAGVPFLGCGAFLQDLDLELRAVRANLDLHVRCAASDHAQAQPMLSDSKRRKPMTRARGATDKQGKVP